MKPENDCESCKFMEHEFLGTYKCGLAGGKWILPEECPRRKEED